MEVGHPCLNRDVRNDAKTAVRGSQTPQARRAPPRGRVSGELVAQLAGPATAGTGWEEMSRALSQVAKTTKSRCMTYLCSPDPGVMECCAKAKMTVIRMDPHSVTQRKVKTQEDNHEQKRQHKAENGDGYNLNEKTSS